jgi:DNA-binding transcriptional regulator GbsR (MarR family)
MTKRELERKINRAKEMLKDLEERKDNLSKHGYWEIGYLKGKISVLEDWLDEITELLEEVT